MRNKYWKKINEGGTYNDKIEKKRVRQIEILKQKTGRDKEQVKKTESIK